tara:strand:- start:2200 stop:3171 length:972 start_codon:yes stop_codon:yes gene_type:complete
MKKLVLSTAATLATFTACGSTSHVEGPAATVATKPTSAQSAKRAEAIIGIEHTVLRDGQRIRLWEKSPADIANAPIVVFVHGATWSGRPDFDLQIRDYSVMEAFVRAGFSTFAIDVQGYGTSDDPIEGNWSRTEDAAKDLAAAVEWIASERKVARIDLFGWSWGAQIAGLYAMHHAQSVRRLVLQGFTWGDKREPRAAPTERFRTNTKAGAASDFIVDCYEQDVVDLYVQESMRLDPVSPNGVILDFAKHLPLVAPEQLTMPVMLSYGAHEVNDARLEDGLAFYRKLPHAERSFNILEGGGHAILLEKPHRRWQRSIIDFFRD